MVHGLSSFRNMLRCTKQRPATCSLKIPNHHLLVPSIINRSDNNIISCHIHMKPYLQQQQQAYAQNQNSLSVITNINNKNAHSNCYYSSYSRVLQRHQNKNDGVNAIHDINDEVDTHNSKSSNQNKMYNTATNHHHHPRQPKYNPTNTNNNFQKLQQSTTQFLQKYQQQSDNNNMNLSEQSKEIVRLVTGWNAISAQLIANKTYINQQKQHNLDVMKMYQDERNQFHHQQKQYREIAEIMDRLVHILLDCIENEYRNSSKMNRSLIEYCDIFNMSLLTWRKVPPSTDNGIYAERLLQRIITNDSLFTSKVKSTANTITNDNTDRKLSKLFGATMDAWASSLDTPTQNGALHARRILDQWKSISSSTTTTSPSSLNNSILPKPSILAYNICLKAYSLRGMYKEAEQLLNDLEEMSSLTNDDELCPDVRTYSICINAYSKLKSSDEASTGINAADRAEDLLQRMLDKYDKTGNEKILPNQYTFGTVIALHGKSKSKDGAQNAERILQWHLGLYQKALQNSKNNTFHQQQQKIKDLEPQNGHFVSVMSAYVKRRTKDAPLKLEQLLIQMEQLQELGTQVRPNYMSWSMCLDAWVKSDQKDAAEKAEQILNKIEDTFLPSITKKKRSTDVDHINNYCYNVVIDAWSRSGVKGSSIRAETIFQRLNKIYESTQYQSMSPDRITYTNLMKAYLNDKGVRDAAAQCERLILEMEQKYSKSKNEALKPDLIVYSSIINAFAKIGDVKRAVSLLDRMEILYRSGDLDFYPNIACFNGIINAYSKSKMKDAALQAEKVLERIEEIAQHPNPKLRYVKPNVVSYASCIEALARSYDHDKIERSERLMTKIIELWRNKNGDEVEYIKPYVDPFNSLAHVYAKSKLGHDKIDYIHRVIDRIKSHGLKPDCITYNIALTGISRTPNNDPNVNERLLRETISILNILQSTPDLQPDSTTYYIIFTILDKLISGKEDKTQEIRNLFRLCCNTGVVNGQILSKVKRILGSNLLFNEVLMENKASISSQEEQGKFRDQNPKDRDMKLIVDGSPLWIPFEWGCNSWRAIKNARDSGWKDAL